MTNTAIAAPKFSSDKAVRKVQFEVLYAQADAAGRAAAEAKVPVPMTVNRHANQLDDSSPIVQSYHVAGGICGFAWVLVRPANGAFARWLRTSKQGWKPAYGGGVQMWVHDYGQSLEVKSAYAGAFAGVLRDAGIPATGEYRMD